MAVGYIVTNRFPITLHSSRDVSSDCPIRRRSFISTTSWFVTAASWIDLGLDPVPICTSNSYRVRPDLMPTTPLSARPD